MFFIMYLIFPTTPANALKSWKALGATQAVAGFSINILTKTLGGTKRNLPGPEVLIGAHASLGIQESEISILFLF